MVEKRPLTIEILALGPEGPIVHDRVIGGTTVLDEAKRIGERLLSRTEIAVGHGGYRILNSDSKLLFAWPTNANPLKKNNEFEDDTPLAELIEMLAGLPAADKPIRLGIVSGFFRQHSNWKIPIKGWLKMLNRTRFRASGYYTGTERDGETDAAAALCDRFVQGPLSLDGWRRTILNDAPHVLIFPEIGMDKVSAQLAAQRLAAVQCASWGHPVTSGFPSIDYFISSDLMEPAEAVAHYSERLVRLPNLSIYYEVPDVAPVAVTRHELGLRTNAIVYWCCQSLPKYLPQFDEVFARIATEVRGCQFTFIEFGGGRSVTDIFRARLERAFRAVGLDVADHCVFLPRLAPDRFAGALGQCDVVLDSIGWSGCNSILESLVHNLPIVTIAGEMMRGRHAAAILEMMEVRETTARTVDEYISIAGLLGRDATKRAELSARIANGKHRVYRDDDCILALESFLDRAVRKNIEYGDP
jgi:protein O-GlcNAc transferase